MCRFTKRPLLVSAYFSRFVKRMRMPETTRRAAVTLWWSSYLWRAIQKTSPARKHIIDLMHDPLRPLNRSSNQFVGLGLPPGVPNKSPAVLMCIAVRIAAMIPSTRLRPSSRHLPACSRRHLPLTHTSETSVQTSQSGQSCV